MSGKEPLTTVHNYVDSFNRGDLKGMVASFAVSASILDGMPPHVWQGPTAAEDWYRDVLSTTQKEGASDFFVSLGEPLHSDVTGDSAYLVVPAAMSFKVHGKQVTQSNALFTLALQRNGEEWRIAAWAWAKGRR
jgi:hypothetical protein